MAKPLAPSLDRLVTQLAKLPTIGRRSAERMAYHLLKAPPEQVQTLAEAMLEMREKLTRCPVCFLFTEETPCAICRDEDRRTGCICVVEEAMDALALERTGDFRGRYHALGGRLSPLEGIGPSQLRIEELDRRVEEESIEELILATNPSVDGEATALYLVDRYRRRGLRLSRIALGLPMGGSLEYADPQTLQQALTGRTPIS